MLELSIRNYPIKIASFALLLTASCATQEKIVMTHDFERTVRTLLSDRKFQEAEKLIDENRDAIWCFEKNSKGCYKKSRETTFNDLVSKVEISKKCIEKADDLSKSHLTREATKALIKDIESTCFTKFSLHDNADTRKLIAERESNLGDLPFDENLTNTTITNPVAVKKNKCLANIKWRFKVKSPVKNSSHNYAHSANSIYRTNLATQSKCIEELHLTPEQHLFFTLPTQCESYYTISEQIDTYELKLLSISSGENSSATLRFLNKATCEKYKNEGAKDVPILHSTLRVPIAHALGSELSPRFIGECIHRVAQICSKDSSILGDIEHLIAD